MSSFANLKRNKSSFEKLTKAIEAVNQPADAGSKEDTRFWQPQVDKSGNGMAIVRFLPAPAVDGDDALPWVRLFSHGFQGPGGWLIDNCLTTLNQKCPVCEHNNMLWNSGVEANKEVVRKQKRKLNYIANVLIVSDPKNPENEGQVKLFKFGKKIFDKISEAMNPEFEDETPVNPFDFWEGSNFKLKIRNVEGYRNYDKSEFDSPEPLFGGNDEKLEAIWKKEYSLQEFLDPKHFKAHEVLKARLEKVLGFEGAPIRSKAEEMIAKIDEDVDISTNGDEDDLDYFKNLAEDR
ncbi:MAG: single-stranded DNA-binding protein [Caulobacteraceae bacterium]|nr:single-stranded DNA-binding protein [Caulobacteraceae bacterium]